MFFLLIFICSVCSVRTGMTINYHADTCLSDRQLSTLYISSSRGTDCRLQKSHQRAMHHASLLRKVKSRQHLQITQPRVEKNYYTENCVLLAVKESDLGKSRPSAKSATSYAVMRNARPGSFQFCAFARNDLCFATLPTNQIDRLIGDL